MADRNGVNVYSEIGKLRRVIVHRPGPELDNLTPPTMKEFLFEDIPDHIAAGDEHDQFVDILEKSGAEVYYSNDILAEVLADPAHRLEFLNDFLSEAHVFLPSLPHLYEHLLSMEDIQKLVSFVMAGLRREDYRKNGTSLDLLDRKKMLLFDPMPNLYFTRDPMSVIGRGVSVNCMWAETRQRESLIPDYVIKYHPLFKQVPLYFSRGENATLEGGDILILSREVLAVGISQRTETAAVKTLAQRVLTADDGFRHVLVFMIPERRAFMHLDTVFTMVDREIFTIHPEIEGPLELYDITVNAREELRIKNLGNNLPSILKTYLRLNEVELVRCGGRSRIDSQREQWNDGANTLAIAPGEVIVYDRNRVTNRLLREAGVIVHEIVSSELSRGRGGPRCMTQPLWREDVD
ncbi:MAG: arginine deiminase [Clostridiaceae bacterium]|nr:arginine deiminase [Clostridiaceae bacterium]